MVKSRFLLVFVLLIAVGKLDIQAQDDKFKAIFIYNFTKLIEWPPEHSSAEFIITVCGSPSIITELQAMATRMKVNNKPIVIKQVSSLSQVSSSQIVFVGKDKTAELASNLGNLTSHGVLIITEKPAACSQGAGINFISKSGNLAFEISPSNIQKANLKVSSQLLSLGTVIN